MTEVVGRVVISYGFAGPDLTRHIKGRICPSLDQHAGSERSRRGGVICSRVGQAADFVVEGVSTAAVAEFLVSSVPFDRLYYYGADRPLHVSVGPQRNSTIVWMSRSRAGRLVPRVVGKAGFLTRLRRGEDEAT